jgi:serine/threonine-protein kinase
VLDFGVAKAAHRVQTTKEGTVKGKISSMSPEQLLSEDIDRRADIYACAVVAWEVLTGERLFDGENQGRIVRKILDEGVPPPSAKVAGLHPDLDQAVMKGLEKDPNKRWQTAREFAAAPERALPTSPVTAIGEFVESIAGQSLSVRAKRVKEIESRSEILPAVRAEQPTIPESSLGVPSTKPQPFAPLAAPSTKPQAFGIMRGTDDVDVSFSEPPIGELGTPMPTSGTIPKAPRPPTPIDPVPSKPPVSVATPASEPRLRVPSPFAPMPVQTLAVSPIANLDPKPAPRLDDLLRQKQQAALDIAPTDPEPFPAGRKKGTGRMIAILTTFAFLALAIAAVVWKLVLKR